ncbi:methyltransferase-like protein 22 [Apus apus]|uniref:methyltransferase-like protein 22 n=1 Tax=Apus apus TaxID=8895 RepID=UPI0021F8EAAF|nr:methyltransferase-like protein 22 [Apus apus]XP_051488180.1 methyltransferase-like protein 22 [Apus apus]XP_051488181.1 methyltransferase-like protein 22 [Apus apus]XP_051488182.1 methyltransferase-like protein 22 [Apus apus]
MVDVAEKEMDNPTFQCDTVLSDVHLHCPNTRHLMVRLNAVGQPVFLSHFKLLWNTEVSASEKHVREAATEKEHQCRIGDELCDKDRNNPNKERELNSGGVEALLDDDGDLEVVRRPRSASDLEGEDLLRDRVYPVILMKGKEDAFEDEEQECTCGDVVKIEHTMATPLEDVGKQVWRAAFLLADYILFKRDTFRCCSVLELGGGTGMTSIIMGTVAKRVYCTDVGEDLLSMCEQNVALNKHLKEPGRGEIKVKELDWLKDEFCTDPKAPYSWSEEEIADLHDHCTVIMAADVFYDDDLTDALFRTLYRITHNLRHSCTVYLALEKRLNFTLRHMDVTCEAYSHFRENLNDLENLQDRKMKYTVEPIKLDFCQFLVYERIEQLELWKIIAEQLR